MTSPFAKSGAADKFPELEPVELPMHGREPLKLALRVVPPSEDTRAIAWAKGYAREQGVDKPAEGEPIYERGLMAARLARACVTVDSDAASPTFFFADAQEILDAPSLGDDRIQLLYERYELYKDRISPSVLKVGPEKVLDLARELAEARDPGPFVRLRPGMRWLFTRSMAAMLVTLVTSRSPDGGSSPSSEKPSSTPRARSDEPSSSSSAEGESPHGGRPIPGEA